MEVMMNLEVETEMDLNSTRRAQLEICCCWSSSWSSYVLHADSVKSCRRGAMASRCQGRDGFYLHLEPLALRWSKQKRRVSFSLRWSPARYAFQIGLGLTTCLFIGYRLQQIWPFWYHWVVSPRYLEVLYFWVVPSRFLGVFSHWVGFVRYLHILYYWLMYLRYLDVVCNWVMCQILDV